MISRTKDNVVLLLLAIFASLIPSGVYAYECFKGASDLRKAVDQYLDGYKSATSQYGPTMNEWCVKDVTSFRGLFSKVRK